jgi:hypothetical protein
MAITFTTLIPLNFRLHGKKLKTFRIRYYMYHDVFVK